MNIGKISESGVLFTLASLYIVFLEYGNGMLFLSDRESSLISWLFYLGFGIYTYNINLNKNNLLGVSLMPLSFWDNPKDSLIFITIFIPIIGPLIVSARILYLAHLVKQKEKSEIDDTK